MISVENQITVSSLKNSGFGFVDYGGTFFTGEDVLSDFGIAESGLNILIERKHSTVFKSCTGSEVSWTA